MKAAVYYENGDPSVLKYEDAPDPQVHPKGIVIRVEAENIWSDDPHDARVLRAVSSASTTVVVGSVGVETCALVRRMAPRLFKGLVRCG